MKTKLLISCILLTACSLFGGSWYVSPSGSLVFPSNSSINYYGMKGNIKYTKGFNTGLEVGYDWYGFKSGVSYDYTSFRASNLTLSTPYGVMSQGMDELYHSHTILFNSQYNLFNWNGFSPFIGGGAGVTWDDATVFTYQAKAGVEYGVFENATISIGYIMRRLQGDIILKHKTISEPHLGMLQLGFNYNF